MSNVNLCLIYVILYAFGGYDVRSVKFTDSLNDR